MCIDATRRAPLAGTRNVSLPPRQSTHPPTMNTIPPLSHRLTTLIRPLSRAGREMFPGYYLVHRRPRISKVPPGSPISRRVSRQVEVWAISLWWPIARVLCALDLYRRGIPKQAGLGWWRALATARHNPAWGQAPMMSLARESRRNATPLAATPGIPDGSSAQPASHTPEPQANSLLTFESMTARRWSKPSL